MGLCSIHEPSMSVDNLADIESTHLADLLMMLLNKDVVLSKSNYDLCESLIPVFANSNSENYSLLNGKSRIVLILALYFLRVSDKSETEKVGQITKKIISDKSLILSEVLFNGVVSGRTGILMALTFFYFLERNDQIYEIIHSLLILIVCDARFYKKGISWLASDLTNKAEDADENNLGIYIALTFFNRIFKNSFVNVILKSICVDVSVSEKKDQVKGDRKTYYGRAIKNFPLTFFQSSHQISQLNIYVNFFNTAVSDIYFSPIPEDSNSRLTYQQGILYLIKSNFADICKVVPIHILAMAPFPNGRLNQYDFFRVIKNILRLENSFIALNILRRTIFKTRILDKSKTIPNHDRINDSFYLNSLICIKMQRAELFSLKLSLNTCDIIYELMSSTWLYEFPSKRKELIACFRVRRFDKQKFVEMNLIDGIVAKLFTHIGLDFKSVNDFKIKILNNQTIDDEGLRDRLLVLIAEGVLIPSFQ